MGINVDGASNNLNVMTEPDKLYLEYRTEKGGDTACMGYRYYSTLIHGSIV
jgi:hypothetical protein